MHHRVYRAYLARFVVIKTTTGHIAVICVSFMGQILILKHVDERKCSHSVHCHGYWIDGRCSFLRHDYSFINEMV